MKSTNDVRMNGATGRWECIPDVLKINTAQSISGGKPSKGARIIHGAGVYDKKDYRDLTRAEYDAIVASKVPYDELLSVYDLFANTDGLQMNTSIATPIW